MNLRISALALTILALFGAARADAHGDSPAGGTTPPPRAHWMVTMCKAEDSNNCAWNAKQASNMRGHSFYTKKSTLHNLHGDRIGHVICVYYVQPTYARHHNQCWTAN